MSTDIRPEVSINHKYWVDRHRFYELRHFCLQYKQWQEALSSVSSLGVKLYDQMYVPQSKVFSDPTAKTAEERLFFLDRIEMVEKTAKMADEDLAPYIIKAVSEGYSYDGLKARFDIPASKDTYYDRYRKFFWLLSKMRK